MNKCVIALDAGGTFLKSGLFVGKELVAGTLDKEPVNSSSGTAGEVKKSYINIIKRMAEKAREKGLCVERISTDIPAPFDYENGVSHMKHKYASIYGVPLRTWFCEAAGDVPVRFMHDSAAFIQGAAADVPECSRIAGVMIGTGFGFGMMIDGDPLRKENGEPLVELYDKPLDGKTAEDFVSARGLVRIYEEISGKKAENGKEIGDGALAGDEMCVKAFNIMADALVRTAFPVIKEYKIQALVLGGQISNSFPVFEKTLKDGFAGAETLKKIIRTSDIDMVHLVGAAIGK